MMRSLYSGVAGLKTHQTRMDVIGNNIANVNTTAYKSSSMTFSELMSQTTQKASGANATTGVGGTNAITTQGSSQSTGNPFDIMITGGNFFVVSNGSENFFTRDGSFYVDGAGNLAMTSTGYNVMGWGVDKTTGNIKQDTVTALRIMSTANKTYPPEATTKANISGILDQNDKDVTSANGKTVNLNFFDARGYSYTAKFTFKQSGGDKTNEYSMELNKILDSTGKEIDISGITFGEQNLEQTLSSKLSLNTDSYKWDDATKTLQTTATPPETVAELDKIFKNGALITDKDKAEEVQKNLDAIAKAYGYEGSTDEFLKLYTTGNAGQVTVQKMLENMSQNMTGNDILPKAKNEELTMTGRKFDGAKVVFDKDSGKLQSINNSTTNLSATLNFPASMGNFSNITIDLSKCTNYDNKGTSTIGATSGDLDGLGTGRRPGDMIGVSIQKDGMIYASYDNGMTKLLGQIATAAFANASGLEKEGDNLYSATLNSGEFDGIGVDITAGGGYMSTGQLEMSNVDLSSEFTEMITTQRGFQANSRIITVSDTLLEELTNLKR